MLLLAAQGTTQARELTQQAPTAQTQAAKTTLRWQVPEQTQRTTLRIAGPDGTVTEQTFAGGQPVVLNIASKGSHLADGTYVYELRAVVPATSAPVGSAAEGRTQASGAALQSVVQTGAFRILNGSIIAAGDLKEPQTGQPTRSGAAQPAASGTSGTPGINDQVIADDLIVQSSICVGLDCVNGESFGFDTLRLKENNTRIKFEDTSTGAFPAVDWQLTANDNASGGEDKFSLEDVTNAKVPFTVRANAPTNSLYVSANGYIGRDTNAPVLELHLHDGDTPAIRLEQSGGGWGDYTWDIGGNEAGFFIRDVPGGSRLPFRILPGASSSSLVVASNSNVGIGTLSPSAKLEVNGNVLVQGNVVEYSDVNAKENFAAVDGTAVLDALMQFPVLSWNYKADGASVRHIGPTAQDFYRAFGLGQDDRHIAPLDTNGVALAAIQELYTQLQAKDAYISELEQRLADQETRLQTLEQRMNALEKGAQK